MAQAQPQPRLQPCPRCVRKGTNPPSPRAVSRSGKQQPYCRPCTREYQNARNSAVAILHRARYAPEGQKPSKDEIQQALETLTSTQHRPGRPAGDNICPTCKANQRAENDGYCKPCRAAYQRARNARNRETVEQLDNLEASDHWPEVEEDQNPYHYTNDDYASDDHTEDYNPLTQSLLGPPPSNS